LEIFPLFFELFQIAISEENGQVPLQKKGGDSLENKRTKGNLTLFSVVLQLKVRFEIH